MTPCVQVGDFAPLTLSMGPGKRACLWVRGCPMRCMGCVTQEFIEPSFAWQETVDELFARICAAKEQYDIEGISFSGGEPFAQAELLAELARRARAVGLSTLAWSGFSRKHLEGNRAPRGASELLAALDVLIDGPFVQKKAEGNPLRGSSNQRVHFLTERYNASHIADAQHVTVTRKPQGGTLVQGVVQYDLLHAVLAGFGVT